MKKIMYIVFTIFLVCSLSSCNISNEKTRSDWQSNTITINEQKNFDVNVLNRVIKENINNDIWYLGKGSEYFNFLSKTSKITVYESGSMVKQQNWSGYNYAVLFETKFKTLLSGFETEEYFAVLFWKGEKGFSDTPAGCFVEMNYTDIINRLNENDYKYIYSSNISFDDRAHAPIYEQMTSEKEDMIANIENLFVGWMKDNKFIGKYKVTLKNFNINDYETYLVVENQSVNWAVEISLGSVILVHKYVNIGNEISDYTIDQYKKEAIYTKGITIN